MIQDFSVNRLFEKQLHKYQSIYIYIKIYKHFIVKTVISKVSWLQCFLCDVFWIWQQISVKWLHCVGHGFGRPPNVAATLQPEWPGWSVTVRSDYLPLARTDVMGFLYFWWICVHFYITTGLSMAKVSLICCLRWKLDQTNPITQIHPVKFQIVFCCWENRLFFLFSTFDDRKCHFQDVTICAKFANALIHEKRRNPRSHNSASKQIKKEDWETTNYTSKVKNMQTVS